MFDLSTMPHVLLIEDDKEVVAWLSRLLEADQRVLTVAERIDQARQLLGTRPFAVAIVDLHLPDGRGLDLLPALRAAHPEAGILVFSAHESDESIVQALEAGADDYVVKPVAPAVFRARLAALQRRAPVQPLMSGPPTVGDIDWEQDTRRIVGPLGSALLTPKEWHLFLMLAVRPDRPVPRATVLAAVWGYEFDPQTSVLDVALSRLRRKLAQVSRQVSVHGQREAGVSIRLLAADDAGSTPSA